MRILITGGTGLVGGHLVPALLQAGHELILLSRKPKQSNNPALTYTVWQSGQPIPPTVGDVQAIINMAGVGLADHRWTDDYKRQIVDSRVMATRACADFIRQAAQPPTIFISFSAVGYYGTHRKEALDESAPPGDDFLAHTAQQWEAAAQGTAARTVHPRLGVVLAKQGGAFPKLEAPFKLFAGGYLGTGVQPFPWVHIDDVVGILRLALEDIRVVGPMNVTAPELLNNRQMSQRLGDALHRPTLLAVPSFGVKALLGESAMMVLEGQSVRPAKAQELGYQFIYPQLSLALQDLVKD